MAGGRRRGLVGKDAQRLDEPMRSHPEGAYDMGFGSGEERPGALGGRRSHESDG